MSLRLKRCHYLGPFDDDSPPTPLELPSDWGGDPFEYLPPPSVMTAEERDLADRYERGDFSGGYVRSQIAYFRKPKTEECHQQRHARLDQIVSAVDAADLTLPDSFLALARSADAIDRIRHNTIWLRIYPRLVPFPSFPDHKLIEIFYEGQGCGYWGLLLYPDRSHVVVFYDETLDKESYPEGRAPRVADLNFYQCADRFDDWLAYYFIDCNNDDQNYEEMLMKYPGL